MTRRATLDGLDVQRPAVGGTKRRFRMRPTTKFLAVCGAIAGGLYVAYLMIFPTVYLRYRLTLDADVDGVTRTGSGVVEIAYQGMPDWLSEIGQGSHFGGVMRGYAITVDLGERGLLFVVDSRPFSEDPTTHLLALPKLASLNMISARSRSSTRAIWLSPTVPECWREPDSSSQPTSQPDAQNLAQVASQRRTARVWFFISSLWSSSPFSIDAFKRG